MEMVYFYYIELTSYKWDSKLKEVNEKKKNAITPKLFKSRTFWFTRSFFGFSILFLRIIISIKG